MPIASFSTLLLATVLAGPALWHSFVIHDLDPTTALIRFLIAVPLAAAMIMLVGSLMRWYRPEDDDERSPLRVLAIAGDPVPQRRTTDQRDGEPSDQPGSGSPAATDQAAVESPPGGPQAVERRESASG